MQNVILKIKNYYTDIAASIDKTSIKTEFFYFVSVCFLFGIAYFLSSSLGVSSDTTWFWSGIIMLIFSLYYIEPYFTSPTNVFTNSIALLITILPIGGKEFGSLFWWYISIFILSSMVIASLISKSIYDDRKSEDFIINKISGYLKIVLGKVGQGKVLYSIVFVYFLLLNIFQKSTNFNDKELLFLFLFFCLVLIISPKSFKDLLKNLFEIKNNQKEKSIGKIFSVQSDNVFLMRLYDNKTVEKFSSVYFRHQMSDSKKDGISVGFLFDIYYLNSEKWGKIVKIKEATKLELGIVQKIDSDYVYFSGDLINLKEINDFVGVVNDKTTIDKLFFEYSQRDSKIEKDDLLQVNIRGKKVFYQIINACTNVEKLESYNEKGFIVGEAIQVGCWNTKEMSFDKLLWVPLVNEAVYIADTSEEEALLLDNETKKLKLNNNEMQIGLIPKTKLPSVIKLDESISHHMAILGVTGSGKSVFARKVIENLKDTKVICVDFTFEWKKSFSDIEVLNKDNIKSFLETTSSRRGIVEIPSLNNTVDIIDAIGKFFETVFSYAKEQYKNNSSFKMVIILEEAHTIVPEEKFLGVNNWDSKAIVNKVSQIALQGRKYGVGLLVIGQRSANISKTVLTQCNTIVAFKAFDDTSYGFLTNYFGKDIIQAIPNLKDYHAVVYGKGIKSKNPIIINTYDEAVKNS